MVNRVRNIGGIGKTKPIPVIHFIPPLFAPVWKIEAVTDNDTIDLTELLVEGSYLDGVTSSIGNFEFKILDPNNTYSNTITEFDTINVYVDYGKVATTLRFSGRIERLSNTEQIYLVLSGRSVAMITTGVNITYSSKGLRARSLILKELIAGRDIANPTSPNYYAPNFPNISITGIEDDLTQIEINYEEMPLWDVVEELCTSGGRDAYISAALDFKYFEKGTKKNITEAVVEEINLIEATEYARDTQEIYTKVRVYGQRDGQVPLIASSISDTSNTKGIIKELKIDNTSIVTETQASELAIAEATDKKIPPTIGSIISIMLPTLLPGEKVNIANPTNNIPPATYQINSFRQTFTLEGSPQTELIIQKERQDLSTILKSNIRFKSEAPEYINKNDLDNSMIFDYNTAYGEQRFSGGTHNNTTLSHNTATGIAELKTDGSATASWTSDNISLGGLISKIEVRVKATDASTTKYFVSLNGGITFVEIGSAAGSFSFDNAQDSVMLRVDIKSAGTRIEKIGLLYSNV